MRLSSGRCAPRLMPPPPLRRVRAVRFICEECASAAIVKLRGRCLTMANGPRPAWLNGMHTPAQCPAVDREHAWLWFELSGMFNSDD
jgi:hypothetical protein